VSEPNHEQHRDRDVASLMIIGGFFAILSVFVLIGTFFEDRGHGQIVNVGAGLILLLVGVVMMGFGQRLKKR